MCQPIWDSSRYKQQGPAYHWKTELNKRLNLPVYDGVEEELEKKNKTRKRALDIFKSENTMKRRVAIKSLRGQEAQERIYWTKQHGQDTNGGSSEIIQEEEKKVGTKPIKRLCTKCGSNTRSLPTHHSCPFNSKKMHSTKNRTMDAGTASDSDTAYHQKTQTPTVTMMMTNLLMTTFTCKSWTTALLVDASVEPSVRHTPKTVHSTPETNAPDPPNWGTEKPKP